MLAIGIMSGTSMDGIDVSLIKTDGENQIELFANYHQPYEKNLQLELKQFIREQQHQQQKTESSAVASKHRGWTELEQKLTILHAQAVSHLIEREKCHGRVEIVGFHGQTIVHEPERQFTWQMGDANLLAKLIQIDVVGDFRRRDVAYGGQGAPLVPAYHQAIMHARQSEQPLVVVNIGGVTNFTYIGPKNSHSTSSNLIAFDVGPGNALIDDLCHELFGVAYDNQGELASQGTVDRALVDQLLRDDEDHHFAGYLKLAPPKSLDRNHFARLIAATEHLANKHDRIATVSYFTVAAILHSIREHLPGNGSTIRRVLVCGGGARNRFIMNSLAAELLPSGISVATVAELGLDADFIESQAFAYLAVRFLRRLPATFPTTTGVKQPVTAGALFPFK